jgi:hypothetical protein
VVLVSQTKQDVPGNGYSINPQITPDGRFVTYDSTATGLVRGDTNDHTDVFLADLAG